MFKWWKQRRAEKARVQHESHEVRSARDCRGVEHKHRSGPITIFRVLGHSVVVHVDPKRDTLLLGRSSPPAVDVYVNMPSVSRVHARLDRAGPTLIVSDQGSRYGVYGRGRLPDSYTRSQYVFVEAGDRFRLGSAELLALDDATHELTPTLEAFLGGDNGHELERALECAATGQAMLLQGESIDELAKIGRALHDRSPRSGYGVTEVASFTGDDNAMAELCMRARCGTLLLHIESTAPLRPTLAQITLTKRFCVRLIMITTCPSLNDINALEDFVDIFSSARVAAKERSQ